MYGDIADKHMACPFAKNGRMDSFMGWNHK